MIVTRNGGVNSGPWTTASPLAGQPPSCVLGVDPGPVTGVCWLGLAPWQPLAFQCSAPGAYLLAAFLLEASDGPARVILAGERFIAGRGPGARGADAAVTRQVITDLDSLSPHWHWRSAAEVKPWATDARLRAAGLLQECRGMPHAADACRHALFAAVRDGGVPDPLSQAARRATLAARPLTPGEMTGGQA